MKAEDALKLALSGVAISHKSFTQKDRFIVCAETDQGLELIDTASDAPVCWSLMIKHYGDTGWQKHNVPPLTVMLDSVEDVDVLETEAAVSIEYLSDQMEELSDLLTKVIELAEKNVG
jgi:hypothetical protein